MLYGVEEGGPHQAPGRPLGGEWAPAFADGSAAHGLRGSPGPSAWNRLNLRTCPQMDSEPGTASLNDAQTSPLIGQSAG